MMKSFLSYCAASIGNSARCCPGVFNALALLLSPCNSIGIHQKKWRLKWVKQVLCPLSYGGPDLPPAGIEPATTSSQAM